MFKSQARESLNLTRSQSPESGNAVIIVLGVLVVVAVAVLAFMSSRMSTDGVQAEPAAGEATVADAANAAVADGQIEQGNPVVARVNGQDITRVDVFNFIQTLPPNMRQAPVADLFPAAVEQVVNARIIENKTKDVNLDNDEEVKKQLELAKQNIVRGVYIQGEINKRMSEERVKSAYEQYKSTFPKIDEVKASHILVKDEAKAKELITQLDGGGNFADLAKANSIDGTAQSGGELGYFSEKDVVPEFAAAAFKTDVGSYTKEPVKSEFGYHVIKVEDKRVRPPAEYDQAKPFLEAQLRTAVLNEIIQEWKDGAKVERFDINGKPLEPAAGNEAPAAPPADAAPAAAPAEAPAAQ